jgi:surface polysaccharide O-acyltransferase-like enzyme
MSAGRFFYIDVLKVTSIFLVIVNHTNSEIFLNSSPSIEWFASVFYFYSSKMAVPVFIMCTGALLLSKVDNYKKHFKRAWRGVSVLIVASFIYYHAGNGFHVTVETVNSFVHYFINKPTSNALWYLYLYVGIVCTMPFLQRLAVSLEKRDLQILISLSLFAPGILSLAGHFMNVSLYERADFFIYSYPIGYLFVGHYINSYGIGLNVRPAALLVIFITTNILATFLTYLQFDSGYSVSLYWSYLDSLTVVIPSVVSFYAVITISKNYKPSCFSGLIRKISLCTFGMYLFSDMIIILTSKLNASLSEIINPFIACLFWQISIFIVAFASSYLARKVPVVKNYL